MADVTKVSWGKPKLGGPISVAELGAPLPKNAVEELNAKFKNLGFISEDGLSNSNSPDSEKIKAWGGDTVLVVSSEKPDTFTFKAIEALNKEVLSTVYGSQNVSGDLSTGITVKANSLQGEAKSYVIDMILAGNTLKRIVIPNGVVSEIGEINYVDNDCIAYEITLEALPDAESNNHYEYIVKAGAKA